MRKLMMWCLAVLFSFSAQAGETWKVTSLDWQPFSGANLPEGGAGVAVLRAALKAEGIDLVVEFYPWTRAIETAKDPAYAGVYPSWPEDVGDGFTRSTVLFKSPVGFVEPNPPHWCGANSKTSRARPLVPCKTTATQRSL